jgi:hypothetical protein
MRQGRLKAAIFLFRGACAAPSPPGSLVPKAAQAAGAATGARRGALGNQHEGQTGMVDIVSRAKNLILKPKEEWPVIAAEPTDIKSLFTGYVMILAAIPVVASFIGVAVFVLLPLGLGRAIPGLLVSSIVSYILGVFGVFVLGKLVTIIAPKFGGTAEELPAMKLAAFAPTASWLAGVFAIVPLLAILGILGLYSIYLFYLGATAVVRVPQDKAPVFTAVVFIVAIVIFVLVGLVAALFRF